MLKDVRLLVLPPTLDILRWSSDGQLAIATGEDVTILTFKSPNSATPGEKTRQFDQTTASLRQLIIEQIDDKIEPAPRPIYSASEEQGAGYARDVAWSPLGASYFRRCVLAALTTNHMVYIFEPQDHPSKPWKPTHRLAASLAKYKGWKNRSTNARTKRLRSRAQAIAWSPPCYSTTNSEWGDSILAVANDNLEIVLFRMTPSGAEILGHVSPYDEGEVSECVGKYPTYLSHLSWSPWRCSRQERKGHSYLSYAHRGQVFVVKMTLDATSMTTGSTPSFHAEEPLCVGQASTNKHPVFSTTWAPEEINGCLILGYAVQQRISAVTISPAGEVVSKDDFKSGIIEAASGFCFSPASDRNSLTLHLVTMNGKSQLVTFTPSPASVDYNTRLKKSIVNGETILEPSKLATQDMDVDDDELSDRAADWYALMESRKDDFMAEREISSGQVRAYGLACSPLGGIISVVISLHPKSMLQYITGSRERSFVVFGTHEGSGHVWPRFRMDNKRKEFPSPINMASEAFTLEALALSDKIVHPTQKEIERNEELGYVWDLEPDNSDWLSNPLYAPPLNALRYKSCLTIPGRPEMIERIAPSIPSESPEIIAHYVVFALRANAETAASTLSKRVLYSLAAIGVLAFPTNNFVLELAKAAFSWLDANTPEEVTFSAELEAIDNVQNHMMDTENASRFVVNAITSNFVRCELCGAGMVWRDLRIAECADGHRFPRCAMTFLPITKPDRTKECMVCARMVLVDEVAVEDRKDIADDDPTLAEVLFREWNLCLQCGGHYWAKGH